MLGRRSVAPARVGPSRTEPGRVGQMAHSIVFAGQLNPRAIVDETKGQRLDKLCSSTPDPKGFATLTAIELSHATL